MVLDEASPTADSGFSSDNSFSDIDASSSNEKPTSSIPPTIDLAALPQPVPIIGPFLGYNENTLKSIIERDANTMSKVIQRPLSVSEWEAAAFHMAKLQSYSSYGWPVGILVGSWRAYSTMNTMRFPFYKPDLSKVGHRFDKFPGGFTGQTARQLWQCTRFFTYGIVGGAFIKSLSVGYAFNVAWTGQRVDPRLRTFWDDLRRQDHDEAKLRRGGQNQYTGGLRASMEGGNMESSQQDRSQQQQQQSVWQSRRQAAARGEPLPMAGSGVSERPAQPPAPQDYFFDDASPTAQKPPPEQNSLRLESSWDQVRRGSAPATYPRQSSTTQEGQNDAWAAVRDRGGGDRQSSQGQQESFSFSSSDQDRQLARAEAQRDFDTRMESERRGGNFEDSPRRRGF